ncbi:hypothetical protein AB6E88_17965 [Providencia hangzhouensis]
MRINNLIIISNGLDYKTDINDDGFTTYQIPSNGIACSFQLLRQVNQLKVVWQFD